MRKGSVCARRLVLLAILVCGCASRRQPVPAARDLVIPPLRYDLIRDQPISVQVSDRRPKPDDYSLELVDTVRQAVSDALQRAEVRLDAASARVLEIRIDQFQADLRMTEWKGCVTLSATVKAGAQPEESRAEQCVTAHNTDGERTGDQAVAQALQDALGLLLHQIDRMGR
jgi:hypothetical protein